MKYEFDCGITASANDSAGARFLEGMIESAEKQKEITQNIKWALFTHPKYDIKIGMPHNGWVKGYDKRTKELRSGTLDKVDFSEAKIWAMYTYFGSKADIGDLIAVVAENQYVMIFEILKVRQPYFDEGSYSFNCVQIAMIPYDEFFGMNKERNVEITPAEKAKGTRPVERFE